MTNNPYYIKFTEEALSKVPFHYNADGIKRMLAQGLPIHIAVHVIRENIETSQEYVAPHKHNKLEINLFLSDKGRLAYQVTVNNIEFRVDSPAAVWIPRDVMHSAKFIEGSGHFICIILDDKYNAVE